MENGGLELGLLKLPKLNFWVFEKANGRVSGAPETCFFMFFGLNAAPSKTSNLSNFWSFQIQVEFYVMTLGKYKSYQAPYSLKWNWVINLIEFCTTSIEI